MSNKLNIGEVVLNNDIPMIVLDFQNRESRESMSYDRSYKLCSLEELEGLNLISAEEFDKLGMWIQVKGTKFPDIQRVKDVAPFEISKVTSYRIRQKQAKTVVVYE